MREHFVLREVFHSYTLLEVLIKTIRHKFSVVPFIFVSVSVYYWVRCIVGGVVLSIWLILGFFIK